MFIVLPSYLKTHTVYSAEFELFGAGFIVVLLHESDYILKLVEKLVDLPLAELVRHLDHVAKIRVYLARCQSARDKILHVLLLREKAHTLELLEEFQEGLRLAPTPEFLLVALQNRRKANKLVRIAGIRGYCILD